MQQFRQPNINGRTEAEQLSQIKNYLFRMTNQLNLAFRAAEDMEGSQVNSSLKTAGSSSQAGSTVTDAADTFANIKNLIIKSADIVNAYYEVIEKKLSGQYVASSDYGTFKQDTEADILANSTSITQTYNSLQVLQNEFDDLHELRRDNCYIRTGWLDDTLTEAGVEVGRYYETADGAQYRAFARFTDDELSFYDANDIKIAWFGQYKLHVTHAEITGNLQLGGYLFDTSDGLAIKWVGD